MVQSCSAYGCKNRYQKDRNISFHKFPLARPEVCVQWVSAMSRRNFKPTKYSNICSQHFTSDCFKQECNNRVLKDNAVPSLFTLQTQDPFSADVCFPLNVCATAEPLSECFPEQCGLPDGQEAGAVSCPEQCVPPGGQEAGAVSCDHNYTLEDCVQQKRRVQRLQEQMEKLRRRMKTLQQKCRRQERQLERLRATRGPAPLGDRYVILPRELYEELQGVETIGAVH